MTMAVGTSADIAQPLTADAAAQLIYKSALYDAPVGTVGLEVETHLVDLTDPAQRVPWPRVLAATAAGTAHLQTSTITVEPGGQVELSGAPADGVAAAVAAMRHDEQRLRLVLAERDLGLAHLGADPLRPPRRVNDRPRYRAMEHHFATTGRTAAGATMMCSTAAVQVNLQAGPSGSWRDRVAQAHRLGPTLSAIAACSRWLSGSDTGWASARQRAWLALDPRTSGALPLTDDPAADWTRFALAAPVVLATTSDGDAITIARSVPFSAWLSGRVRLADRRPTLEDLHTHLSTLFPPVRLRGYLELRYLDVSAPRWWPAVAAVVTTLMDDPVAADLAAEATEPVAGRWIEAAQCGLRDPALAAAARRCLAIAVDHAPSELGFAVRDLAQLIDSGRSPGDLIDARIAEIGPRALLDEVARA